MNQDDKETEKDPVEAVVEHIHIVGAVLSFMLAFIAITMA